MYRPSRIRRILKWTGAGLSLFILAACITSCWYRLEAAPITKYCLSISGGQISVARSEFDLSIAFAYAMGLHREWNGMEVTWPRFERRPIELGNPALDVKIVRIPFWLPFLVTAIPTAWLWHRDRRSQRIGPGCCLRCGYNLTGNTSGVCSECGLPKPPPATV